MCTYIHVSYYNIWTSFLYAYINKLIYLAFVFLETPWKHMSTTLAGGSGGATLCRTCSWLIIASYVGQASCVSLLLKDPAINLTLLYQDSTALQLSQPSVRADGWEFLEDEINVHVQKEEQKLFNFSLMPASQWKKRIKYFYFGLSVTTYFSTNISPSHSMNT